ncbi:hypothetical protein ACIBF6_09665 [Streptosporangium amethystogenes]|uniref:hypothetical protein n=1 Tax=Streptosporangium amethystogenes TaxID=2002 RepID=UPI003792582A
MLGPVRGLSVTGQGAPGGPAYPTSLGALYAVAGALLGIAARSVRPFRQPVRAAWTRGRDSAPGARKPLPRHSGP